MKENQVVLKKRERFFLEDKFYLISKGSIEVGNNINLEDINTNSKKGAFLYNKKIVTKKDTSM